MAADDSHTNGAEADTSKLPSTVTPAGSSFQDKTESKGRHLGNLDTKKRKQKWGKRASKPSDNWNSIKERSERFEDRKRRRLDKGGAAAPSGEGKDQQDHSLMSIPFTADEIAAEERRPKRKVAVMIGYAGTGYHGMQINHDDKTIEGDLFSAFVAAGAISKANANDPKKSSLVRCARTDKGVHAAGNVVSLKLIVEDEDVVNKINENLPEQIRIWGIQRTNNSFSAYQACDSRWYEYLLPSYSLLPPHPNSFLGQELLKSAKAEDTYDEMMEKLADVKDFWEDVDKNDIEPLLENMNPEIREKVRALMFSEDQFRAEGYTKLDDIEHKPSREKSDAPPLQPENTNKDPAKDDNGPGIQVESGTVTQADGRAQKQPKEFTPAELAHREVKMAYVAAKRRYRITPTRLQKLQDALNLFCGTNNFHNYTIQKSFKDPSAKRLIKSFEVNPKPVQIRDTEWLSLKVHGQSFMMHQIRKMVAMAVMLTRCSASLDKIPLSYQQKRISIPKAPGLGLLLERPVFDYYNSKAVGNYEKPPIDFANYEKEIEEFKNREIYARMWDVEEKDNVFHSFFNQIDNFRTDYFLWVTARGFDAAFERNDKGGERIPKELEEELGDEGENPEEGDG